MGWGENYRFLGSIYTPEASGFNKIFLQWLIPIAANNYQERFKIHILPIMQLLANSLCLETFFSKLAIRTFTA